MKVVLIGPAFPLRGGIADFNEALSKAFTEAGDECVIYSFYYQYPGFLFPGKTQKAEGPMPAELKIQSTLSSLNPLSWFRTVSFIRKEKPGLVIIRFWLPFMAPALGTVAKFLRRKNVRVIAITDNVIPHEKRPGDRALTGYFIRQCDAFVTMSKSVLEDLSRFTDTSYKIFIPHPVYNIFGNAVEKSVARKNLGLKENDRIILFFGFIRKYKGLGLLLEAMTDKRIREKSIKLIVAGEFYEEKKPYLDIIENEKLSGNVILHSEFISKEKVKDYFCASDIVVQPYLDATQSGITQIAYHFGRPMLVTDAGGLAEIVRNGRTGYVISKSAQAIAESLCDFYNNNREGEMSANVQADKHLFSWSTFINGIKDLYEKIK